MNGMTTGKMRNNRILDLAPMLLLRNGLIFTFASALAAGITAIAAEPSKAPPGMVWIPGGEFKMGAAMNGNGSHEMPMASNDAEPIHPVLVDGFWMDKTVVTNADFAKFVAATGYVTVAERAPTKEEFPMRLRRTWSLARLSSLRQITRSR